MSSTTLLSPFFTEVTIGFEPSVYTVSEAAGLVEVCAVNVSGTLARSVTVTFTPQETGSATGELCIP